MKRIENLNPYQRVIYLSVKPARDDDGIPLSNIGVWLCAAAVSWALIYLAAHGIYWAAKYFGWL